MAIVELNMNDPIQAVVTKCNYNFRHLSNDQKQQNKTDIYQVNKNVNQLAQVIDDLRKEIESEFKDTIKDLKEEMEEIVKKSAPPIGTWMYTEYDPNEQYPDTEWERVAEGTFLISSGETYETGEEYGENEHVLTVNEMPSHTHTTNHSYMQNGGYHSGYQCVHVNSEQGLTPLIYTRATGGSQPHNNIPQSIAIPLWHRVK